MKSYLGKYSMRNMEEALDATIILSPNYISVGYNNAAGLHTQKQIRYSDITYKYTASTQTTAIACTNSSEMIFIPNLNIEKDLNDAVAYNKKSWFAKKMGADGWKLLATCAVIMSLLVVLYLVLVPFLSEQLGKKISKKTEANLGQKLYSVIVDTTKKDTALSNLLNQYFKTMEINTDYKIQVTALKDNTVNAFAIMGGNIVVYTGLLEKMKTHEELAALLSHEFSHIQYRHTTRSVFRALGKKAFLALLLGDMGGLGGIILSNADELNGLGYSRKLEKEADVKGLELLNERAINGEGFVNLFTVLKGSADNGASEILSSHPDIEKRIGYIKKDKNFNTGKTTILSNKLADIFEQIQSNKKATSSF